MEEAAAVQEVRVIEGPDSPDGRDPKARHERHVRGVVAEPLLDVIERPTAATLKRAKGLLSEICDANPDLPQALAIHFQFGESAGEERWESSGFEPSDVTSLLVERATNQIALYEALGVAAEYMGRGTEAATWRESSLFLYRQLGPIGSQMMISLVWNLLDQWNPPTRIWAVAAAASLARSRLPLERFQRGLLAHGAINHAVPLELHHFIFAVAADRYLRDKSDPAIRVYLCLAPFRLVRHDWSVTEIEDKLAAADRMWSAQSETDFQSIRDDENPRLRKLGLALLNLLATNPTAGDKERLALLVESLDLAGEDKYQSLNKLVTERRWEEVYRAAKDLLGDAPQSHASEGEPPLNTLDLQTVGLAMLAGLRAGEFDTLPAATPALRILSMYMVSPEVQMSTNGVREFFREVALEFAIHHASLRTTEGNQVALLALESLMSCGVKNALLRLSSNSAEGTIPEGQVARYALLDEASSKAG
jgi:hypothetical protein